METPLYLATFLVWRKVAIWWLWPVYVNDREHSQEPLQSPLLVADFIMRWEMNGLPLSLSHFPLDSLFIWHLIILSRNTDCGHVCFPLLAISKQACIFDSIFHLVGAASSIYLKDAASRILKASLWRRMEDATDGIKKQENSIVAQMIYWSTLFLEEM